MPGMWKEGEVGMTDREKVIKALECHVNGHPHTRCHKCPYWGTGPHGASECSVLAADALALLKAQEPRVMTLEEIQHTDAVWLETHGWKIQGGDIHETVLRRMSDFEDYVTEFADNDDSDITCDNSKLGIDWRCWTSRPDEKRRAETPWED